MLSDAIVVAHLVAGEAVVDADVSQSVQAIEDQLMGPEGQEDPYPHYHRLRELAPLYRTSLGFVMATRYDDCLTIMRDPRFTRDPAILLARKGVDDWADHPSLAGLFTSLSMANPPYHTHLRGLAARAFSARTVEALRPMVERVVDVLLEPFAAGGRLDIMGQFAYPMSMTVIGEMLGVPEADRAQFKALNRDRSTVMDFDFADDDLARADRATTFLDEYFLGLFADRRRSPGDDLISTLLAVRDDEGDRLTDPELLSLVPSLFVAGFETTANLVGNGLMTLIRHPDEAQRLRREPSLVRSAVEELLRYDSSVQALGRQAPCDLKLGGMTLATGEWVVASLGAANRDPARFPEPDRFDVTRSPNSPLSFGGGIHFCLGAPLARLEASVAFSSLLDRFPGIDLAGTPERTPWPGVIRGFLSLPIDLSAA
jgi:cytochrome P450